MADGHHHTKVVTSVDPATYPKGTYYVASCDCGWVGRPMDTKTDAQEDADEHVRLT